MNAGGTIPAQDYRRLARRIRFVHRGNPAKTQQALKNLVAAKVPQARLMDFPAQPIDLAIRSASAPKIDWSTSAILGHRTPQARQFADQVAQKLIAGILSWSNRQKLLVTAARMGIARFEANLIIAAVQHRMGQKAFAPAPSSSPSRSRLRLRSMPVVLACIAIEAIAIVGCWRIWF